MSWHRSVSDVLALHHHLAPTSVGSLGSFVSAVNAAVEKARIVARKAGKFVRSLEWIFAVPHTTRASSFEKVGARNPSFAAGGNVEMAVRALKERAAFLGAYREAFAKMRNAPCGMCSFQ
jgi:putative transposase